MNPATSAELERALWRYGDDLYHLALLLTPNEQRAGRIMVAAVHRVASGTTVTDESSLTAALVAALPREPAFMQHSALARLRRPPAWARPATEPRAQAPLLRAIALLPRQARLALGLTLLHPHDPAQIALLTAKDEAALRQQIRDSLLALAPVALPDLDLAALDPEQAPEECRPTRAALALGPMALQSGPARAHLALCAGCRAAEQAWSKLTSTVEEALRGAFRKIHLPPALAAQLHAGARANQAPAPGPLDRTWVRIALVALPVLAVIGLLVVPRGAPEPSPASGGAGPGEAAGDLASLVRRARAQLYQPPSKPAGAPAGADVWHSQYSLQWNFRDGSSAPLSGNLWIDQTSGRHRAQLAHHLGGGPYEFELADGRATAWYAAVQSYAPVIYPFGVNQKIYRARLSANPQQQREMLAARLRAGAWQLPDTYLREAARAELRSWGHQRDANGRSLTLISFRGASPLGFPADSPEAAGAETTILLAIDADGRLREVRELAGAAGAEQIAHTTWRLESEEWIAAPATINTSFDLKNAWNGVGDFVDIGPLVSAQLPLIQADAVLPLSTIAQLSGSGTLLPVAAPPGADFAIALNLGSDGNVFGADGNLPIVYTGDGRSLALLTLRETQLSASARSGEAVTVSGQRAWLQPALGQVYSATLLPPASAMRDPLAVQLTATGYTRAEMLEILRSLAAPTLQSYRAQARLFYDPHLKDAAYEALLAALAPAPAPPEGGALHFVERVFKRHRPDTTDPLADPYHRPPYGGWPERWTQDNWARGSAERGTAESTSRTLDGEGRIIARQYRGPKLGWDYDAPAGSVYQYPIQILGPVQQINEDQGTVLRMMSCGDYRLYTRADGTRAVALTERDWQAGSCQNSGYGYLRATQRGSDFAGQTGQAPFLADVAEQPLSTAIDLGADGRPARTQVWAGLPDSGTLLESWERVSEELVAADRVPADTFTKEVPAALLRSEYSLDPPNARPAPREVTLAQAQSQNQSALLVLPDSTNIRLQSTLAEPDPNLSNIDETFGDEGVFDLALRAGYAIQFTYTLTEGDQLRSVRMFEGRADRLGAYLRRAPRWQDSTPTTIAIGGQKIAGWQVIPRENPASRWLLFELDGTLVAAEYPPNGPPPPIDRLQRAAE